MSKEKDKKKVLSVLEENLKKDRIKNQIIHFTDLGLVEMTRKRQGKPLGEYYQEVCPCCHGTGVVKSIENIALDILREIRLVAEEEDIKKVKLNTTKKIYKFISRVYLDFIKEYLKIRKKEFIMEGKLEEKIGTLNKYEIVLEI
jgi:ribonuclease G